jgi:hypothetical protein
LLHAPPSTATSNVAGQFVERGAPQSVPPAAATCQSIVESHVATMSQLWTGLAPYSHARPTVLHGDPCPGPGTGGHTGAGPPSLQVAQPPLLLLLVVPLLLPLLLLAPLLPLLVMPLLAPLLPLPLLLLVPPLLPVPLLLPLPEPLAPPEPLPLLLAPPPSPPPPPPPSSPMDENEAPPHAMANPPSHPSAPTTKATLIPSG